MSEPTIADQIRTAKSELEQAIAALLQRFEADTGLTITNLSTSRSLTIVRGASGPTHHREVKVTLEAP